MFVPILSTVEGKESFPSTVEGWKKKMLDVRGWDDIDSHYDDRLLAIIGSLPGFDPCIWVSNGKRASTTISGLSTVISGK